VIDNAEVQINAIFSGVQCVRVENHKDATRRWHHGYLFWFTGDPQRALEKGQLHVTLLDDTTVRIVVPAIGGMFLESYNEGRRQMRSENKLPESFDKSLAVARNKYRQKMNPAAKLISLNVSFNTGETLTNEAFSPSRTPFGRIRPSGKIITGKYEFNQEEYERSELWVGFFVPRHEEIARYPSPDDDECEEEDEDNLIVEDLVNGVSGMAL